MYSRAQLSRTVALVVALSLTAVSTGAGAREFRAADAQSEDYPTVQALGRMIVENIGGRHQVRVFHSRQLGEEKETVEQTRAGAIDLNRSNMALAGLRLRVQLTQLMSDVIRNLGSEPVELPYGQVLTGLATRLTDGAETNGPSVVMTDHYRKPFEAAMAGTYAKRQRDPEAPRLIERIRKME